MDFSLSTTQQELAALVRQIVTTQLTAERRKAVEAAPLRFDRALWQALLDADVVSAALPASIGGGDLDLLEQASVLVELGRAVAPVPYLPHVLATAAIAHLGTDAQRAEVGAPAARGETLLTVALTEEFGDPAEPATTAERSGDGWVVTGAKSVVPFGTAADAVVLGATVPGGTALFLVDTRATGVTVTAERATDGDEVATLALDRVAVAADRVIEHADALHWLVARATVAACAYQLGVLERALELTVEYARTREQFGRPIGSFQAVGQRLADAYIDVEAVRLTMWEAAWRVASGLPCPTEVETAKFWAADAGHRVAHTAVHVHGGTGIDLDGDLHRYFTAAKRTEFLFGDATAQLLRLGAQLAASHA
ncbi:MAG: acyl-CoA dehydrogenase family protein [Jatrophihabitans sp.]|uniref:acyl-CoA dehydrogenase family protein n=1 Tax=Jatrophihabitans sp. TaxID=1932789 RepID=UPI003F802C9A